MAATATISDTMAGIIRTAVPAVVGAGVAFAAAHGIAVDTNTVNQLVYMLTPLFIAVYYAAVRLLENKFPQAGWLLGFPASPSYATTPAVEPVVAPVVVTEPPAQNGVPVITVVNDIKPPVPGAGQ